jgi:hypothetical protein
LGQNIQDLPALAGCLAPSQEQRNEPERICELDHVGSVQKQVHHARAK